METEETEEKKESKQGNKFLKEAEAFLLSFLQLLDRFFKTLRVLISVPVMPRHVLDAWLRSEHMLQPVTFLVVATAFVAFTAHSLTVFETPEGYGESIITNLSHVSTTQFLMFLVIVYLLIHINARHSFRNTTGDWDSTVLERLSYYVAGLQCFCVALWCACLYMIMRFGGMSLVSHLWTPMYVGLPFFMFSIPAFLMESYISRFGPLEDMDDKPWLRIRSLLFVSWTGLSLVVAGFGTFYLTDYKGSPNVTFLRGSFIAAEPSKPVQAVIALRNGKEISVMIPKDLMSIAIVGLPGQSPSAESQATMTEVTTLPDEKSLVILGPRESKWVHFQFIAPTNWPIWQAGREESSRRGDHGTSSSEFVLKCQTILEYSDEARPSNFALKMQMVPVFIKAQSASATNAAAK